MKYNYATYLFCGMIIYNVFQILKKIGYPNIEFHYGLKGN